jgi:hypothetical protein
MVTEYTISAESYYSSRDDRSNNGKHESKYATVFTHENIGNNRKRKKRKKRGDDFTIILVQRSADSFLRDLSSVGQIKGLSPLILVIYEFIYLLEGTNNPEDFLIVPNGPPVVLTDPGVVLADLVVAEIVLDVPNNPNIILDDPVVTEIVLAVPIDAGVVLTVPIDLEIVLADPNNPCSVSNVSDVILGVRDNLLPVLVPLRPINLIVDGSLLHIPPLGSFCQSVYFIRFMVCPHQAIKQKTMTLLLL